MCLHPAVRFFEIAIMARPVVFGEPVLLSFFILLVHLNLLVTMPKSKRSKLTTLSKTPIRSTKASKQALVNEIRENVDKYDYCWMFSVGDMRNDGLKEVRAQWRGTGRFFFGKGKVMAKALGDTPETEYQDGLSQIAKASCSYLTDIHVCYKSVNYVCSASRVRLAFSSPLILLMKRSSGSTLGTSQSMPGWVPSRPWTSLCLQVCYLSNFCCCYGTVTLTHSTGPLLTPFTEPPSGDPFPHSMEPQLRALGLTTSLVRGIPSLNNPHVLCVKGEKLTSEKCRILKLLAIQMAVSQAPTQCDSS